MEDRCESGKISVVERSDFRVSGEKRGSVEMEEQNEIACKRATMRDLESLPCRDGFSAHGAHFLKNEKLKESDVDQFNKEGMRQIAPDSVTLNVGSAEEEETDKKYDGSLDLNTGAAFDAESRGKSSSLASKNHGHVKSRDISECGSTTGSLEDNEPLRRWKEMKQNGFLSASYGGKQLSKQRPRRTKSELMKKKMEIAKREQVDRFTKIAAPSGLLNELNPGIINHVRNRRQVHSIIESLVRSEKLENGHCGRKQANHLKSRCNEIINWKESENMSDSESEQVRACPMQVDTFISKEKREDDNSSTLERVYGRSCARNSTLLDENDTILLKLSPTENAPENAGSFSNEEYGNLSSITTTLSVKAATVASQWLELLHRDVNGRLAALRRSKKRVHSVINTELPLLISKEFSLNQENSPCLAKNSTEEFSVNAIDEKHRARWAALFNQMDRSLSEEEKQLESWLDQVKGMQLLCDEGLHHFHWNSAFGPQKPETLENDSRSEKIDSPEKELAVHAAAASIYSTSNYVMTKENISCF